MQSFDGENTSQGELHDVIPERRHTKYIHATGGSRVEDTFLHALATELKKGSMNGEHFMAVYDRVARDYYENIYLDCGKLKYHLPAAILQQDNDQSRE